MLEAEFLTPTSARKKASSSSIFATCSFIPCRCVAQIGNNASCDISGSVVGFSISRSVFIEITKTNIHKQIARSVPVCAQGTASGSDATHVEQISSRSKHVMLRCLAPSYFSQLSDAFSISQKLVRRCSFGHCVVFSWCHLDSQPMAVPPMQTWERRKVAHPFSLKNPELGSP